MKKLAILALLAFVLSMGTVFAVDWDCVLDRGTKGAEMGAAIGAGVGSVVPGVGTATGGAVGGAVGAVGGAATCFDY